MKIWPHKEVGNFDRDTLTRVTDFLWKVCGKETEPNIALKLTFLELLGQVCIVVIVCLYARVQNAELQG